MVIEKINLNTVSYASGTTVVGQDDTPNLDIENAQLKVENMPRNLIVPKVNELIDDANNKYTKTETDAKIAEKVVEIGTGDMAKATYDTNNNGVVDSCEWYHGTVTTSWNANEDGSYSQTVTIAGITADMVFESPCCAEPESEGKTFAQFKAAKKANHKALGIICDGMIAAGIGRVFITVAKPTTTSITLYLRERSDK